MISTKQQSRSVLVDELVEFLRASGRWTAPYGIIANRHESNRYHVIVFGIARALDADVRIYGPSFILLRTSRHPTSQKFTSLAALREHLSSNEIF